MKELEIQNRPFRYERKFVVPCLNKKESEAVILSNSFLFREIYYERQINNIYLDTLDMTSYFDNTLGNSDRIKIRIRWYGELEKIKEPVLEIKVKRGLVGTKLSFPLKPFSIFCRFDELQKVFESSNLPDWLMEALRARRFALLNCYKRKYYLSACGGFRITIDSDLTYLNILNQPEISLSRKVEDDYHILELKYDVDRNPENITTQFPFRMTKSSKYVTGLTYFLQ